MNGYLLVESDGYYEYWTLRVRRKKHWTDDARKRRMGNQLPLVRGRSRRSKIEMCRPSIEHKRK